MTEMRSAFRETGAPCFSPDRLTRRLMRLVIFFAAVLLCAPGANGQDELAVRNFDVSAYPAITFEIQLRDGGTAHYPIDGKRIVARENGRLLPMTLNCPEPQPPRPSVAIGFERSLDGNFPPAVIAARRWIAGMRFTDHHAEASFWSFATTIDQDVVMTRDSVALQRAVEDLRVASWPFNGTALYETMHNAIEDVVASGSGAVRAIIFVTDGYNNSSWYGRTLEQVRGRAAVDNVRIYVLLLRNRDEGLQAMESLTRASGGFMLEHDVPGAVDSMYSAIVRPDAAAMWCDAAATAYGCADGGRRRFEIGCVRAAGDTLWQLRDVVVPYRPEQLQSLPVWFSPETPWDDDTLITVAWGVELRDDMQPPAFELAVPMQGMILRSAESLAWNARGKQDEDTLIIGCLPPASGLRNGFYTLGRLTFSMTPRSRTPFSAILRASGNNCIRLEAAGYPAVMRPALDTARGIRNAETALRLRVARMNLPEGLQRLDLSLRVDPRLASFPSPERMRNLQLSGGWRMHSAERAAGEAVETLTLRLRGAAGSTFDPISLPMRISAEAPYRIPVRIEGDILVNGRVMQRGDDGLLVIRDSCYNNVIALNGVVVSQPYPQPARGIISFRVISPAAAQITCRVLDAAGRVHLHRRAQLDRGSATLRLDCSALPPGRYFLHCGPASQGMSFPLVIVR
jgi:hypothetical protein